MQTEKFLLAILPPPDVLADVLKIKEHFRDNYRSKGALNAPAHITLHMPFEWRQDREEQLIRNLLEFSDTQHKFRITLHGFDSFPPRVIFVNVMRSQQLDALQKQLHSFCKTHLDTFNAGYKDQPFHPHVTVAFRDLRKTEFLAAWDEFKQRQYDAEFECDSIELLKHDGKFWKPFKTLPFR